MAKDFDPTEHTASEVKDELKDASPEEVEEILAEEKAGKQRSSVLQAAEDRAEKLDAPREVRKDSRGREMFPWEVNPK